jgi:hypothetical protein
MKKILILILIAVGFYALSSFTKPKETGGSGTDDLLKQVQNKFNYSDEEMQVLKTLSASQLKAILNGSERTSVVEDSEPVIFAPPTIVDGSNKNIFFATVNSTKSFQRFANDKGYQPKLKVDGLYGNNTSKAYLEWGDEYKVWHAYHPTSTYTGGVSKDELEEGFKNSFLSGFFN